MERKDLYLILILLESMLLPFLIPFIGFLFPSLVYFKGFMLVLLIFVIWLVFKLFCSLSFKKKTDIGWIAYAVLALVWNMVLILHFVFFGFDDCPGCGF